MANPNIVRFLLNNAEKKNMTQFATIMRMDKCTRTSMNRIDRVKSFQSNLWLVFIGVDTAEKELLRVWITDQKKTF